MKRKMKVCVISDVHLGTKGSAVQELNRYLKSIQPEILVLNGDIIDGWRFNRKYWPSTHSRIIRRILKMSEKGTLVYLLPGNHDESLRHYCPFTLGNVKLQNDLSLKLDGKNYLFLHGDIFDLVMEYSKWLGYIGAWAYDTLIWANTWVNILRRKMGMKKVSFSQKVKASVKSAVKFVSNFETVCADYASNNGYDGVICGHIHTVSNRIIGNTHYLNSGDWVESMTALEYIDNKWTIYKHNHDFVQNDAELDDIDLGPEINFNALKNK